MKPSKLAGPQTEEEVLPQQATLQACPVVVHQVHKAERHGIRGKELEKVYKRARKA